MKIQDPYKFLPNLPPDMWWDGREVYQEGAERWLVTVVAEFGQFRLFHASGSDKRHWGVYSALADALGADEAPDDWWEQRGWERRDGAWSYSGIELKAGEGAAYMLRHEALVTLAVEPEETLERA